jgi:hypothetical protein
MQMYMTSGAASHIRILHVVKVGDPLTTLVDFVLYGADDDVLDCRTAKRVARDDKLVATDGTEIFVFEGLSLCEPSAPHAGENLIRVKLRSVCLDYQAHLTRADS